MSNIILADRYDLISVISEQQKDWVTNILLLLGLTNEEISSEDPNCLFKHDLQVWNNIDFGDIEIIKNGILIAKWYAPKIIAKYDTNKKIYYEIHIDCDSSIGNEFHFAETN